MISPAPTINGAFFVTDACATQNPFPTTDKTSISIEMSSVWCVFNVLKICGMRIKVQKNDANHPNKTSIGIAILLIGAANSVVDFFHVAHFSYAFVVS